jgi:hypothetical protein
VEAALEAGTAADANADTHYEDYADMDADMGEGDYVEDVQEGEDDDDDDDELSERNTMGGCEGPAVDAARARIMYR